MKFPNAYSGVKKIFSSEVLSIIAAVCLLLASFFAVIMVEAASEKSETGLLASFSATGIFTLASGIVGIIALVLLIIGVSAASKDEPTFKTAFTFIIVNLLASALALIPFSDVIKQIFNLASNVAGIFAAFYIIYGIQALAVKCGDAGVEKKGKTVIALILCTYIIALVATILGSFVVTGTAANVVSLVGAIVDIVRLVIYVVYLAAAKKMLANTPAEV
ncbi:MAG: hypothetical protein IJS45_11940 [Clostridia bacterium]|nr:hypothetical protein [Clostridia bacterium]